MGNQLVLANLSRRRACLAGEIEAAIRRLKVKRRELATIDAMLKMLDAGMRPGKIKSIRRHARIEGFRQGELTRLTLVVLRQASEPVSANAMAEEIARLKGVEASTDLVRKVRSNLMRLAREGRVERSGVHRGRLWAMRPDSFA